MKKDDLYLKEETVLEILKASIKSQEELYKDRQKKDFIIKIITVLLFFIFIGAIFITFEIEYWNNPPIGNKVDNSSVMQIGDNNINNDNNDKGDD